jgi:hypothetical protein
MSRRCPLCDTVLRLDPPSPAHRTRDPFGEYPHICTDCALRREGILNRQEAKDRAKAERARSDELVEALRACVGALEHEATAGGKRDAFTDEITTARAVLAKVEGDGK